MDERNVGTLEACQRLVKAGIVLETDFYWAEFINSGWQLITGMYGKTGYLHIVPAPSMAEVWRELPNISVSIRSSKKETHVWLEEDCYDEFNTNPTDALIDLLVWVTEQRKEKV